MAEKSEGGAGEGQGAQDGARGQQDQAQQTTQTAAQSVDLEAVRREAREAAAREFGSQLKELVGVDSLDALEAKRLEEQGKFEELARQREADASGWRQKFERSEIKAAIVSAAGGSVDPAVVHSLLQGEAKVGEDGVVTIAGKAVAEAVKALLGEKPYLAKAAAGEGSGASAGGATAGKEKLAGDLEAAKKAGDTVAMLRIKRELAQVEG